VNAQWDIGAYEWSQNTNPGWQIQEGFKEIYTGVKETESVVPTFSSQTYPIITSNKVLFRDLIQGSVIQIYNIAGRLVHGSLEIAQGDYEVDISKHPSGVFFYILRGDSKQKTNSGKFVIFR
jgi:hypothetical protein